MSRDETNKFLFIPRLDAAHVLEWALFCLLLFYLVLRAIYVPPLHDEVATFFHYIEVGDIWSETAVLDANNHLLNSYLSRFMYLLFGEDFFFLRLPNIFAFFLYFWSVAHLLKGLNHRNNYIIGLIALNTVPFILEYFALTRGYGMGIAFFVSSIALLIHWLKNQNTGTLFACLFAGWLSVLSNLIFINSFALLIFAVIVFMIVHRFHFTLKKALFHIGSLLLVGLITYPLIEFGLQLKNSGALYYGSLNGFWEVTGKSLAQLVLFAEGPIVKWGIITALLVIITESFVRLLELKWRYFLHNYCTIIVFFLVGNIIITWLLAKLFQVNYPEDRAGIYFVILFLLAAIYTIDRIKWKYSGLVFLFFPITLLFVINISRTVITPDQQLSREFYQKIRDHVDPTHSSLQVYTTQHLIWAYYERAKVNKILALNQRALSPIHDVVVTRPPFYTSERDTSFTVVARDSQTTNYLLTQKKAHHGNQLFENETSLPWNANEFNEVFSSSTVDSLSAENVLFQIRGSIEIDSTYSDIAIVFSGKDEESNQVHYSSYPLRWYFGARNLSFDFTLNHPITFKEDIHSMKIYIWNPRHRSFTMRNSKLEIFELK